MTRWLAIASLTLLLLGCGEEPVPEQAEPAKPGELAAPAPSVAMSNYQQALRHFRTAPSYAFEADVQDSTGSRAISGVQQAGRHLFTLQSTPANPEDGRWLLQAGRFLREQQGSFAPAIGGVDAFLAIESAIGLLPDNDDSAKPGGGEGGSCTLRQLDVAQVPSLAERYSEYQICLSNEPPTIVSLGVAEHGGRRIDVRFKDFGVPMTIPDAGVKEWWQEYPQTKP